VFTFGANGVLTAWNFATGTKLWRVDTRKQFQTDKGFFGIACSPLVEGEQVILNIGGKGAGIMAFDAATGAVRWKATDDEASYSSPIAATFGGKRRLLVLTRSNLVALDPPSGGVLWKFPFRPTIHASVTAATPVIMGDRIFISGCYGEGAAMLRFGETKPTVLWQKEDVLSNHYATSVARGELLFGFDGRQEQKCNLRCVDATNGSVRWSEDQFGAGTLLRVGDQLVVLTERGELIIAPATDKEFKAVSRAQVLGSDCRAHAAFANGLFYARDKRNLVCVDLRAVK
jgi:outer membrane protein assembly factor BamB